MIRKLTSYDDNSIIDLLGSDFELYQFLIDEVRNNNFDSEYLKVYGEYDIHNRLQSFIVNNGDNITYFSKDTKELIPYVSLLSELDYKKVSCEARFGDLFRQTFTFNKDTLAYLANIKEVKVNKNHMESRVKKLTSNAEFGELYDVFMTTEEYAKELPSDKSEYIQNMKDLIHSNKYKVFGLYLEDRLISSASITGVNTSSCIVIGVVTDYEFQGKGYGVEVMIEMCNYNIIEGRSLSLFYTNPNARKLYHKIGIDREVGWRVLER